MNIWLAPLDGITNYHFRNCLCRHFAGIDFFITPFLPTQETAKLNIRNWRDIWPKHNTLKPTIPQLMGNKPDHFVDTMNLVHKTYGYTHFNWNIGCPVAQVVHRKRGCGVMPYPAMVEDVVRAVTEQTPFQFSVKMRLGLHNPNESLDILDRLEKYPLEFIVIHPRLGEQLYAGTPDWDALEKCLQHTHHRVIYSGDVFSKSDYERLQARFPKISDWMLGRGILQNPFLAEEIKAVDTGDRHTRFSHYYQIWTDLLLAEKKERSTLSALKELWHYYAVFTQLSEDELKRLLRINEFEPFYYKSLELIRR